MKTGMGGERRRGPKAGVCVGNEAWLGKYLEASFCFQMLNTLTYTHTHTCMLWRKGNFFKCQWWNILSEINARLRIQLLRMLLVFSCNMKTSLQVWVNARRFISQRVRPSDGLMDGKPQRSQQQVDPLIQYRSTLPSRLQGEVQPMFYSDAVVLQVTMATVWMLHSSLSTWITVVFFNHYCHYWR